MNNIRDQCHDRVLRKKNKPRKKTKSNALITKSYNVLNEHNYSRRCIQKFTGPNTGNGEFILEVSMRESYDPLSYWLAELSSDEEDDDIGLQSLAHILKTEYKNDLEYEVKFLLHKS